MITPMISCNALFFSFFKPSSNARAFLPHRLRGKPLTETPRHGEKLSTGTPPSSSAQALHSDDTASTPPNPVRQNAGPILARAGFKRVINMIKYQQFMPDPSDTTSPAARYERRHQDTEKSSRPERRRPRRHQHLGAMTLRRLRQT